MALALYGQLKDRDIMRSLASGQEITSDTSTLEDRSILDKLREGA